MKEHNPKISFGPPPERRQDAQTGEAPQRAKRQVRKVVHVATPTAPPVPQAPAFATKGLMAKPRSTFLARNRSMIGVSLVVVALSVAYLWNADETSTSRAQFSVPPPQQDVAEISLAAAAPTRPPQRSRDAATRAVSPDLTDVSGTALTGAFQGPSNQNLGAAILIGMQLARATDAVEGPLEESLRIQSANKLRMLREAVLAGVYSAVIVEKDGGARVTLRTVSATFTSDLTDDILLKAVTDGHIDVSAHLRTPGGGVDTDTLVFDAVQRSLMGDEDPLSTDAALAMSETLFAASLARTQDVGGVRFYTVQPGDSLAFISLQFYGTPDAFMRILEANRDTLQSPDRIQVGQRLIIPS